METDMAVLEIEPMLLRVELPVGWEIGGDPDIGELVCVGPDELDDDGYRPSITIERRFPVDDFAELQRLASGALGEMKAGYDGFDLLTTSEDPEDESVVRVYEFDLTELDGRRVRQTQALLGKGSLYVINCTAPLSSAEAMDSIFQQVIASAEAI